MREALDNVDDDGDVTGRTASLHLSDDYKEVKGPSCVGLALHGGCRCSVMSSEGQFWPTGRLESFFLLVCRLYLSEASPGETSTLLWK